MSDIAAEAKIWLEREIAARRLSPEPDPASLARIAAIIGPALKEKTARSITSRAVKQEGRNALARPA